MAVLRNMMYGFCLTLSTTSFVNIAGAAPQHNCAAYASAAVVQNNQNMAGGCGFTGDRWQSNYDAHFKWCQQQNVGNQALSGEDHARKVGLKNCTAKISFCESYARQAVSDQIKNMKHECKLEGSRWQLNHSAHRKWCLGVEQSSAIIENAKRVGALSKCTTRFIDHGINKKPVSE